MSAVPHPFELSRYPDGSVAVTFIGRPELTILGDSEGEALAQAHIAVRAQPSSGSADQSKPLTRTADQIKVQSGLQRGPHDWTACKKG